VQVEDKIATQMERRRHERMALILPGRCMISDRESDCQTVDLSPNGAALRAEIQGRLGEHIIAYLHHIGRIEGLIVRLFGECLGIELLAPPIKRERLSWQIARLAMQQKAYLLNAGGIRPSARLADQTAAGAQMTPRSLVDGVAPSNKIAIDVVSSIDGLLGRL